MIVDRFDPRREAVVEASEHPRDRSLRALQQGSPGCATTGGDRVEVKQYSSNMVSLKVDAASAGLLVLPDTYFRVGAPA